MLNTLKYTFLVAFMGATATTAFAVNTSSQEYKTAYSCGLEAAKSGSTSPIAYCIGNSHDPSQTELKAFAAAKRDATKGATPTISGACTFAYGQYEADGSHADGFAEGPQKIHTLRNVAHMISGRSITLYDANNQVIPASLANSWFTQKGGDFVVSKAALNSCSKKQLGKNAYGG